MSRKEAIDALHRAIHKDDPLSAMKKVRKNREKRLGSGLGLPNLELGDYDYAKIKLSAIYPRSDGKHDPFPWNKTLSKCDNCSASVMPSEITVQNGIKLCPRCAHYLGYKCTKKGVLYENFICSSSQCGSCTGPCNWKRRA